MIYVIFLKEEKNIIRVIFHKERNGKNTFFSLPSKRWKKTRNTFFSLGKKKTLSKDKPFFFPCLRHGGK